MPPLGYHCQIKENGSGWALNASQRVAGGFRDIYYRCATYQECREWAEKFFKQPMVWTYDKHFRQWNGDLRNVTTSAPI